MGFTSELTRDDFIHASKAVEIFLRHFCNTEDSGRDEQWLCGLAIWGRCILDGFDSVDSRLIEVGGESSTIVSLRPWIQSPEIVISMATAHECAATFMHLSHSLIMPDRPFFADRNNELVPWVRKQKRALLKRMKELGQKADYHALLALAATIRRERVLVSERWAGTCEAPELLKTESGSAGPIEPDTPRQKAILAALDGRGMTKEKLAAELKIDPGQLYRPGGINELIESGRVKKKRQIGYYRPDAPPN